VYDVITISESHLHQGVTSDVFRLQGFHDIIRKDRDGNGGGVAIYIKDSISYKRIYKYETPALEALWIQINTIEGKILLCCCYRPPDKIEFWDKFTSVVDDIKADQVKYMFILGDINADFRTANGKRLVQMCTQQNLQYMINEPTRITESTSTTLDQIITNAPNFVSSITVTPPISTNDHCTVAACLNFKVKNEPAYERIIWQYKNANFDMFRTELQNFNFDECFQTNDVNDAAKRWTESFLNVARTQIPNKVVTIRPNDSPWYTNELRLMKRRLQRLFHKHKSRGQPADWENYKNARNKYQQSLDEAETRYKESLCDSLSSNRNTKKWWQTVKWLLGKGKDTSSPTLEVNGVQITENIHKANAFNDFFLSHTNLDLSHAELPAIDAFNENIENVQATEQEVYDLIKGLDTSKATGPDGISPKLLHEAGYSIVPSLTRLINMSLSLSKVPKNWKLANVIPIFKSGEKSNMNNYRPVSLLSCVSKIMEKIVFKHLYNYIKDNNLISPHQSGFQPGDSTVNQLSYLYHTFCEALDKKKDVRIVFCDISKAFDKVWHAGLLYKLKTFGIHGSLLRWFKSYLSERYQKVVIKGQHSEVGLIRAGVPQGSVLGPLLFLIYINDITAITTSNIKLFADDTSLYIEVDSPNSTNMASATLNADLDSLQQWADQWLINFSPSKTKLMTCSFKKLNHPNIQFNQVTLDEVDHHKHLGLTLANNLSWTAHINSVLSSVSSMADVLKRLKYSLDRKSIETIYFSFIRPKLEYCSHVWDNCSKRDAEALENFQLEIMRIVTGARKGTSHNLLYQETKWQTLSERRTMNKLKSISKIADGNAPAYLQSLLPAKVGDTRPASRNSDHFTIIKARTETFKNSFIPSGIKLWNSSLNKIQDVNDVNYNSEPANTTFYEGQREVNIKHAQLRMKCSKLNAHLFALHVIDSPNCSCGNNY
jgi:hypothetical protein